MTLSCKYAVVFLSLVIVGVCYAADYNILDTGMSRRHEKWMVEYGRVYKDGAEKAKRFDVFRKNVRYIEEFNSAGGHSYTLGVNQFTDLSPEEFRAIYTSGTITTPESEDFEESHEKTTEFEGIEMLEECDPESKDTEMVNCVPPHVDWKEKGCVTPAKNQGNCSACWAFAAVATIESLIKIKGGPLHDLSPQQVIDCDKKSNGCSGGSVHTAFAYVVKNGGLTTEANYPFNESTCECKKVRSKELVAKIHGCKKVHKGEAGLLKTVAKQPVAVAMEASEDLQHYKSGVFNGTCGTNLNHAVAVVGYGKENGQKYWNCKNSWGKQWGEEGCFRIERQCPSAPQGKCGLGMSAYCPRE